MKKRRALLFTLTVALALSAACGVWLHREREQYALNRALIAALVRTDSKTALALVKDGADPNTRYSLPPAPTLPQLLHYTPPPVNPSPTAFLMACGMQWKRVTNHNPDWLSVDEDLPLLQAMLAHGADVHVRDTEKLSALYHAINECRANTTELLLQHGANVNESTEEGRTALMIAVESNATRTVQILLEHGANTNVQDSDGYTPLHIAANGGQARIVELLLQHGAEVNAFAKDAATPLMVAAHSSPSDVVHVLLEHGANPNLQDTSGDTALYFAINSLYAEENIPELLRYGAIPVLPNKQGQTPLQLAQELNRPDTVRLLKRGAK